MENKNEFMTKPFHIFDTNWALVTAGVKTDFNTMTISWGGMGTIWSKPVVTVYIKKNRYTHQYLLDSDYFTVSFFDDMYKNDLQILGTLSKRDGDKLSKTQLTPMFLSLSQIGFIEAKKTIICKKIYTQDMENKVDSDIQNKYYRIDPRHTMFIGEVVKIIEQ